MLTTTLKRIRAKRPCSDGWKNLLKGLGKTKADDEPLRFDTILEINGLDDALWCLRAEPKHSREYRLFAVWCARQVQHLLTYQRSLDAIDVAERHANGAATNAELEAAKDIASAVVWVVGRDAAMGASKSAREGAAAAMAAADDAAAVAARSAAESAAWADAIEKSGGAAVPTAMAAMRKAQTAKFKEMIEGL